MENSSHTEAKRALDLDDRPTFSVVIIYQDPDTGRRAKCFYDKMTHEVGEECDFSLELWNFEMLAIPEMRDSSAQAAAQADFLVLSFRGNAELPAQTRYWIERWSRLSADGNPALVGFLIDRLKSRSRRKSGWSDRSIARRLLQRHKLCPRLLNAFTQGICRVRRFPPQTVALSRE